MITELPAKDKKEIVIIGGGLAGCLTALMFSKDPKYHVTLIEEQDRLLNGTSVIAAHLHLGGEYPTHEKTALDCLDGAVIWKLLMPDNIYTSRPGSKVTMPTMKFLVTKKTHEHGLQYPDQEDTMTLQKQFNSYEVIRQKYKEMVGKVHDGLHWTLYQVQNALFGSYEKGEFFHSLSKDEYKDYSPNGEIAGGIQTQELGLNIPKYLTMLQMELEEQAKKGNIDIRLNTKVAQDGIKGEINNFEIHFEGGKEPLKGVHQVVQAAGRGGQAITNECGDDGKKQIQVHQRAMMVIDLPPGWETPPAFLMKGLDGGMLKPFNDQIALCYIPKDSIAYLGETHLNYKERNIPDDWDSHWDKKEGRLDRNLLSPKEVKAKHYFEAAKEVFPILKEWQAKGWNFNPRIVIRDTLNFGQDPLYKRPNAEVDEPTTVNEPTTAVPMAITMAMNMKHHQEPSMEMDQSPILQMELRPGLFTFYPTKATYAMRGAIQAKCLVEERGEHPEKEYELAPVTPLEYIMKDGNLKKYSLKSIAEPTPADYDKYLSNHPIFGKGVDTKQKMLAESWSEKTNWVDRAVRYPVQTTSIV